MCIWVDADACPASVKDLLYKTVKRVHVPMVLVANQGMYVPSSQWVRLVTVAHGANVADDHIVEQVKVGDIVITSDIPLAARVVEKSAIAIGHRGEVFDEQTVHSRLATRNLMEEFRSAGMETSGPRPLNQKDLQQFANSLDRTLTQRMRR
ncbi:MAG: YaiI/YqxD family protein [Planctomycetaceae bacterium]|nr:YaiI/YqxD family protein [Planctomycetaceae bacterium]